MIMFDIWSTTQMLSCGSTFTFSANRKPYTPWPISPTYLPVLSNRNIREPPCANGRAVASESVG